MFLVFICQLFDRVDLIKPVSSVYPCVRTLVRVYVRTIHAYVHVRPSTNSVFDFNEIWHVGRGR